MATARRGADLLDRKLRLLLQEERRATVKAETTRRAWEHACADARRCGLLAVALGGEEVLRPPSDLRADVDVTWTATMGRAHPDGIVCRLPTDGGRLIDSTAALAPARAAYGAAVEAAARHAAAEGTLRAVRAEAAATRIRLRAVEDRWLPALETALVTLRAALAEEEAADAARLRRLQGPATGDQGPAPTRPTPLRSWP